MDDGVTHNYIYDAENRYVKLGASQVNTYDGAGLRVEKVTSGSTVVYLFSGMQVIAEYSPSAAVTAPMKEYVYLGSQLLATLDAGGNPTYRHRDHLSTRVLADNSGNSLGTQGHLPFGDPWYSTGTADKWIFTSYERDSDTLLDYALTRFDSARLARFLAPDPYLGSIIAAYPQSWNRYSYVANDPVNRSDPSGLCDVVSGGVTQRSQTPGTSAQEAFANKIGANLVYPFSQQGIAGSVLSMGSAPTNAPLYEAIVDAAHQTPDGAFVNIITWSGSASVLSDVVPIEVPPFVVPIPR